jgi:hypothetical protein
MKVTPEMQQADELVRSVGKLYRELLTVPALERDFDLQLRARKLNQEAVELRCKLYKAASRG